MQELVYKSSATRNASRKDGEGLEGQDETKDKTAGGLRVDGQWRQEMLDMSCDDVLMVIRLVMI
jgi:hypothetical protein